MQNNLARGLWRPVKRTQHQPIGMLAKYRGADLGSCLPPLSFPSLFFYRICPSWRRSASLVEEVIVIFLLNSFSFQFFGEDGIGEIVVLIPSEATVVVEPGTHVLLDNVWLLVVALEVKDRFFGLAFGAFDVCDALHGRVQNHIFIVDVWYGLVLQIHLLDEKLVDFLGLWVDDHLDLILPRRAEGANENQCIFIVDHILCLVNLQQVVAIGAKSKAEVARDLNLLQLVAANRVHSLLPFALLFSAQLLFLRFLSVTLSNKQIWFDFFFSQIIIWYAIYIMMHPLYTSDFKKKKITEIPK